jgi:Spy/CpxP family protein refolding chaperone
MEKFPKIRFIVITILVITIVNIVALALVLRYSFHEHRNNRTVEKKEHSGKGFDYLKEKLELTPEQVSLFRNEKDSFFASANLVFDELEKKRLEMINEFGKPNPDTVRLYALAAEMGINHGELKRYVVDHMLKLRSYCTPEQLVKLDSMYNFMIRTDSPWRNKSGQKSGKGTGKSEK